MNTFKILTRTVLGAVVALLLTVGLAGVAAAEPAPAPAPVASAPAPEVVAPIAACMPPGDTIELRTGVGAVLGTTIGAIVGLPIFIVGAIPFAIIGGVLGAMIGSSTYAQDTWRVPQNC